jgi:hypothetical protein
MSACRHNTYIARGLPVGPDLSQTEAEPAAVIPSSGPPINCPRPGPHEALTAERTQIRALNTDIDAGRPRRRIRSGNSRYCIRHSSRRLLPLRRRPPHRTRLRDRHLCEPPCALSGDRVSDDIHNLVPQPHIPGRQRRHDQHEPRRHGNERRLRESLHHDSRRHPDARMRHPG